MYEKFLGRSLLLLNLAKLHKRTYCLVKSFNPLYLTQILFFFSSNQKFVETDIKPEKVFIDKKKKLCWSKEIIWWSLDRQTIRGKIENLWRLQKHEDGPENVLIKMKRS